MHRPLACFGIALLFCTVATAQQTIRIGQAVVALTGPWKFHVGDNPRWADPDFDDSTWENVDLTPKGATDYMNGLSEYVPGWATMGHRGYSGYAWYRLKVQIEQTNAPLSLLMPVSVDDGYQVFANGRYIGEFGNLRRRPPVLYFTTAEWFRMPAVASGQATQLAIRFYMGSGALFQADAGGMHGPPRIGVATVIAAFGSLTQQQLLMRYASDALVSVAYIGFTFALFALYWLDRSEKVYLWFGFAYLALALRVLTNIFAGAIPWPIECDVIFHVFSACWIGGLLTAWWEWFGLREKHWLIRMAWAAVLARALGNICRYPPVLGTAIPLRWFAGLQELVGLAEFAAGVLFFLLVIYGIRRQGREGWLALPAALLFAISLLTSELQRLHIPTGWTVLGVRIDLHQIAEVALSAVLGALIIRTFQRSQRRKQQLEADLRQAQQVQQVLLPQEIPAIAGFRIECDYRPAQEVGGDFFQVLETRHSGALVVIGDVSGKGVPAAMLVALIIGTLRTIVEGTEEPGEVLVRLNRRLCGRMEGGFATCLCARIAHDGLLTVANAGHLAPWLDGNEVQVPHDLPLGIAEEGSYAGTQMQLPENGRLTFVSDGVVEAKNGRKELFGFDRARSLSTQSAAQIADAAGQFGQEDDITVVTIQRLPVPAYV